MQPATVQAPPAPDAGVPSAYGDVAQHWLDDMLSQTRAGDTPLRMEVSVGSLDPRLKLAPCAQVEPYLPLGTRLWGRTRIGLRCTDGVARWNVFLPITVKAWGPAWVLKNNLMAGSTLTASDAAPADVDWAADSSPVAAQPAQWVGQLVARPLLAGQPLRMSMIKPMQAFQPGAQIRVVAQGAGFQVAAEGQALGAGVVGQAVRIRIEGGRILSGTVLDAHTVKVEM